MRRRRPRLKTALENGAAALKTGLEKALKGYDAVVGYNKDTAEAVMKSATTAGKSIESINSEIYSYSKQSIEDGVAATKAVLGSKSVHEAFEFQTDYAKSAFEAYVAELSKISELATAATRKPTRRSRAAFRPGSTPSPPLAPDSDAHTALRRARIFRSGPFAWRGSLNFPVAVTR